MSVQNKWLKTYSKPERVGIRLFCFPFAGGSAPYFKTWSGLLPSFIQLSAIQYPGRGSRFGEPLIGDMDAMVTSIEANLDGHLEAPYAFFGHSMGAGIAYALSRRLQAKGTGPEHLFVSGRNAPHLGRKEQLHLLPDAVFSARLKDMNGTPPEVLAHPELMELVLPMLRADFGLSETAKLGTDSQVTCPMTAFGGDDDRDYPATGIEAWSRYTSGDFQYHILAGDHFFIDHSKSELLGRIGQALAGYACE